MLHTSDWHLGHCLMSRDRKEEHKKFLNWLRDTIEIQKVKVLIVSGDIFDTGTPPNYALRMYYQFLAEVASLPLDHVIITGGNHDSPATLNASKEVLKAVKTTVITNPHNEIIHIKTPSGETSALICGVPFLRERDLRDSEAGETYEDKSRKMVNGISCHYKELAEKARNINKNLPMKVPVIATGHLFSRGGVKTDGVRDIYVGKLGEIPVENIDYGFDYIALGHLHKPQKVGGTEHIRYSGSPIPLSFSEASSVKEVVLVDFSKESAKIQPLKVPEFQKLRLISGDFPAIEQEIKKLEENVWLEVRYTGEEGIPNLENRVEELLEETSAELFAVKRVQRNRGQLNSEDAGEYLDDLTPEEVFSALLDNQNITGDEVPQLKMAYNEILNTITGGKE